MTHTPWITAEPDPEAIRRLVEQSFDDRQTVAPDLEALQRSNDATRRSTMAATTPNDLANTHTTLSPNNINDNHAPPTLITQLPIPLPAIQLTMGRAASTSQRSPGEHSTNASASTRVNDHHRPSQATPVPACSLNNQSTDTSAPTGAVIQQTYERTPPAASIPPPSLGEQKVIVSTAANVTKTKDLKEPSPAASQPQQRTEAFANDLSRFSLK
ncbi:hypothetical protein BDB00DRAFT_819670 [Zychaea mexicana]|uniref:uncharacterized protein n=1 Tax=Zychaea mexicana TaxID=64656 RepID=UPI0022FE6E48|nr:uncharacterized protein BDB00DRAFT_819670 [Zychaea mexicana]KAI9494116.1 hypothetical protein BDB00DRAFT_819670 [Zychaea mexicana]